MYQRQIQMKLFLGSLFKSHALRAQAMAWAVASSPRTATLTDLAHTAGDKLADMINKIAIDPRQNRLPACANSPIADPPAFETTRDCKIVALDPAGHPLTTNLNDLDTCREFIEASKHHEENHQDECELEHRNVPLPNGTPRDRDDIDVFANEEAAAYDREVYYLRRFRDAAKKRCTKLKSPSDAGTAIGAAAKNVAALAGGHS
jgi:hypothetical protein